MGHYYLLIVEPTKPTDDINVNGTTNKWYSPSASAFFENKLTIPKISLVSETWEPSHRQKLPIPETISSLASVETRLPITYPDTW